MSGTENPLARVAKPCDDDLDLDVAGVTLDHVVVLGHEIIATFTGGFGSFDATTGDRFVVEPGDTTGATLQHLELAVGYTDPDPEWFAKLVDRLEGWRARAVPLRICAAQGRMTSVFEDRTTWLPFPRSAPRGN